MNAAAGITLGIGIAGFIIGILWKVIDLSVNNGKLQKTVEKNEEQIRDAQRSIDTLFKRANEHEAALASLTTNVSTMNQTCQRIESKLDRLIERGS